MFILSEEVSRFDERCDESIGVIFVVVYIKAGSGRGRDAEFAVEGLGAVMAGPDADALFAEHLADIMGVHTGQLERDSAAAVSQLGGPKMRMLSPSFSFNRFKAYSVTSASCSRTASMPSSGGSQWRHPGR